MSATREERRRVTRGGFEEGKEKCAEKADTQNHESNERISRKEAHITSSHEHKTQNGYCHITRTVIKAHPEARHELHVAPVDGEVLAVLHEMVDRAQRHRNEDAHGQDGGHDIFCVDDHR